MPLDLDHGVRCDRHIGEAFRVRCYDCDALAAEEQRTMSAPLERDLDAPVVCSPTAPCAECLSGQGER